VVLALAAALDLRRAGIGVVMANVVFTVAAVATAAAENTASDGSGHCRDTGSGVYTALIGYLQYLGVRRLPV
jgi:hypothetical protein